MERIVGVLQQLSTKHEKNPIRNDAKPVTGWYFDPPELEQSFWFFSEPLTDTDGFRIIKTSPVVGFESTKAGWYIETENSVYEIWRQESPI